jgi:hypothetical protein
MQKSSIPFLLGGAFALRVHTGIHRETKDIDIFVRPRDFTRVMAFLHRTGFSTLVHDPRWIGKAHSPDNHEYYADIIFGSASGTAVVTQDWVDRANKTTLWGMDVRVLAPEEAVFSKAYVQARDRFDGADINHTILKQGRDMDWRRLMGYMDHHWELFFSELLNFMFVYPSERDIIPRWVIDDLTRRVRESASLAFGDEPICRGPLLGREQYDIDMAEWGFKSIT